MGGDPGTKTDIEIVGIVGIVRDSKYESLRDEMPLEVFIPFQQANFVTGMSTYVCTARNPRCREPGFGSAAVPDQDAREADG